MSTAGTAETERFQCGRHGELFYSELVQPDSIANNVMQMHLTGSPRLSQYRETV